MDDGDIEQNWGVQANVSERNGDSWPVTITLQSGSEVHHRVTSFDELDELVREYRVPAPALRFLGEAFRQLRDSA